MKPASSILLSAALSVSAMACAVDGPPPILESSEVSDNPFANGPMYLTGAFDGSKAFRMWAATMDFARDIDRLYDKPLHFTYFINSAYFDPTVTGSWIGRAGSDREATVRFALAQQAINEGHEIADHTVRHRDGSEWTIDAWRTELTEFQNKVESNLFESVVDEQGQAVFPRWRAMPDAAPGETGASCSEATDCNSGNCLEVAPGQSFCSAGCNKNNPCDNGTVCGAPDWNESRDLCIPMPEFPVVHNGEVLFDENGTPNLESSQLTPYEIVGFRAPQLGHNRALFEILEEMGYRYDTSKILRMGPPSRVQSGQRTFDTVYEFPLMKNTGSATVPMDYNYKFNDISGERMDSDYKASVRDAYAAGKLPWNIGHHFSLWKGGAYWQAMKSTFHYAAQGCPMDDGTSACPNVEFPSFVELADHLDGINASRAGETGDASDAFAAPGVEVDDRYLGESCAEEHDD